MQSLKTLQKLIKQSNLTELQKYLSEKHPHFYVRHHPEYDYYLFNYNNGAIQKKVEEWSPEELEMRGLILNKQGDIIALPFKKFFNLGQIRPKRDAHILHIQEKFDGVFGIGYYTPDNKFKINTKNNWETPPAIWATSWLEENIDVKKLDPDFSYLFEILNKNHKIIVDYKEDKVVLIGMRNKETGELLDPYLLNMVGHELGLDTPRLWRTNLDFIKYAGEVVNEEGFVIRYSDGLMVKVKADDYIYKTRLAREHATLTLEKIFKTFYYSNFKSLEEMKKFNVLKFPELESFYEELYNRAKYLLWETQDLIEYNYDKYEHLDRKEFAQAIKDIKEKHLLFLNYSHRLTYKDIIKWLWKEQEK